jgi:hypothetical protein
VHSSVDPAGACQQYPWPTCDGSLKLVGLEPAKGREETRKFVTRRETIQRIALVVLTPSRQSRQSWDFRDLILLKVLP